MTQNTNTPTLRFPEFKGSLELKKLGEITEKVNSGKTPLGGEFVYVEKGYYTRMIYLMLIFFNVY